MDMIELKGHIEAQAKAWEDFKSANDARLKSIEAKGYAPADTVAKVDAVNTELTKLSGEIADIIKKMQRPSIKGAGGQELSPEQLEHKTALGSYLRRGDVSEPLSRQVKSMLSGSDPDGGFLVGVDMDAAIDRVAATVTGLRSVANVRTVGGASYKKIVKTSGMAGGWLGQSDDSAETTPPKYSEIEIPAQRMYVEPWVPNDLLEDAEYDLEADLAMEAGISFGETEGTAFITGDGVKKPRGLATYTVVANASYAWGKVGYIASGGAGALAASNPGDAFINLQHALKEVYRAGAAWLMADSTLALVRQIKDGSGNFYLWNPDATAGFGGRLLGSPVVVDDNVAAIGSNSYSVAYGNFRRGYTITDRRGTAVIRDNVTKKGMTKFHFSRRVGGGITNFEAIKLMKFAAS